MDEFFQETVKKHPRTGPIDMSWSPSLHEISQRLFVDLHWQQLVLNSRSKLSFGYLKRSREEMVQLVLHHPDLARVMAEIIDKGGVNLGNQPAVGPAEARPKNPPKQADLEARARAIAEKMFGETNMHMLGTMGYTFKKIWKKIYESIQVDKAGLEALQDLVKKNQKSSFIYIPTHRSYIDFLIISYIAYACALPLPYIAAGEDFLGILIVRWIFRHSGAFFIRRSFLDGATSVDGYMYLKIYEIYLKTLLCDGQSLEFYIEGTRSRSGKMLHPKTGMLGTITDLHLAKQIPNVYFVPMAINYEKTIEGDLYSNELLGENKIKENFKNLLKSSSRFLGGSVSFGTISVVIRKAINLEEYEQKYVKEVLPGEIARAASGNTTTQPPVNLVVPSTGSVKSNPTAISVGAGALIP